MNPTCFSTRPTHTRAAVPAAAHATRTSSLALALLLAAAPVVTRAQDAPAAASGGKPLWELGLVGFGTSQQAFPGARERTNRGLVLPYAVYRGQYLRADRDNVGLRAFKSERFELDVGFAGSFGSSSSELEVRNGMPDLGTLVEFGPRLKWHMGTSPQLGRLRAEVALRGVYDLDDGLRNRGVSFEPRLVHERRSASGWNYSSSIGLVAGNRKLGETLYGVAPAYATDARPAYAGESGLVAWRLGASVSRQLAPDWTVFGFARLDTVAGAANRASPLVERRTGATVGLGVSYTWARSSTLVSD